MKRIRRFAAVLLSAAMVVTSIQTPVYAAQDEDLVIEADLQEDESSVEDATEDPVDEAPADEKSADETPAAEPEEETPAESEEEEFTEVPLEGDAEVKASSENLEEIVVGQSDEESDLALDEGVTGNDSTKYVQDAKGFLEALKNVNAADTSKKGKNEPVVIEFSSWENLKKAGLVTPHDGFALDSTDKAAYDQKNFKITKAQLDEQGLIIPDGKEVTIIGNNHNLSFESDATEQAVMKVGKGATLTLIGDNTNVWFEFRVENSGKFFAKNVNLTTMAAKTVFDNQAEGAYASFEGSSVVTSTYNGAVAIHNADKAELVIGKSNGSGSDVEAKGVRSTAIDNEGSFVLNSGSIEVKESYSRAIRNTNELAVRGGSVFSASGVAIYNTGTLGIGTEFAYDDDVEIEASGSFPEILSPGGQVTIEKSNNNSPIIGSDSSTYAISTTVNVLAEKGKDVQDFYPAAEDGQGKLTMYGGTVYGIAYAGENYPTILCGYVYGYGEGACVPITAEGNSETDRTKAHYYYYSTYDKDGKPILQLKDAYEPSGDGYRFKSWIEEPERNGDDPDVSPYTASNATELAKWLSDPSVHEIIITYDIELDDTLNIDREVTLRSYSSYDISVKNNDDNSKNVITVTDAAKGVVLQQLTINGRLINKGELTLKNTGVSIASGENVRCVENTGTLTLDGNTTINGPAKSTYVYNEGTLISTLSSNTTIMGNSESTVIYNAGAFTMQGGTITAGTDGYAVVYTGENYPVLIKGTVNGYNFTSGTEGYILKRAAVVIEGAAATGQYKSSPDGAPVSTKNSRVIKDGVAQESYSMDSNNAVPEEYLLMEKDETIKENDIRGIFKSSHSIDTLADLVLESTNTSAVTVQNKNADGQDAHEIKATGVGHAIVTFKWVAKEDSDRVITSNYLRIDVVEAGKRKELVSDYYTGSILNPNITVNGYKTEADEPVKFEFHSAGAEANTGADASLANIVAQTYKVAGILIEDKEFNRYFSAESSDRVYDSGVGGYIPVYYDSAKKVYSFRLFTKDLNDRASQEGYDAYWEDDLNGLTTRLVADDCKKISNVNVSVVLKASFETGEDARDKTIIVPLDKNQPLNISVKSVAPKIKINPITVNSFWDRDSQEILSEVTNDPEKYVNLSDISAPVGIEAHFDEFYDDYRVTVTGKKGGKINALATVEDYVGTYPVTATVKVTNKAPKVSLKEKKISIYGKAAAETDIYTDLTAKLKGDLDKVAAVNVVGKSAEFYKAAVVGSAQPNNKVYDREFVLQPKKTDMTLPKTMTVDLEVSYGLNKYVKGKPYVTKLKLKVSPVDYNKFSVKQINKPRLDKKIVSGNSADFTTVRFSLNPKTFKGGKFIVTGLNGSKNSPNLLPEGLDFGNVVDEGDGNYSVQVRANAATEKEKKAIKFAVQLIAPNEKGEEAAVLKKQAVMTVNLYELKEIQIKKDKATIDLSKVKKADVDKASWSDLRQKLKATYKVTGALGYGMNGRGYGSWIVECNDPLFERSAYYGDINKNGDLTAVTLLPREDAYRNGWIQSGNTYNVKITLNNQHGTKFDKTVQVIVKDAKKPDAAIYEVGFDHTWRGAQKNAFTLYYNSPYTLDNFLIGEKAWNGDDADYSTAPYMGLTIRDVNLAEGSPYELIKYRKANGSHCEYALAFADKTGKDNTVASLKKAKTVTLQITYSNGVTVSKKVKVNIPDLPKK